MLLVQSIQIKDNFGFNKQTQAKEETQTETVFVANDNQGFCVNGLGKLLGLFESF